MARRLPPPGAAAPIAPRRGVHDRSCHGHRGMETPRRSGRGAPWGARRESAKSTATAGAASSAPTGRRGLQVRSSTLLRGAGCLLLAALFLFHARVGLSHARGREALLDPVLADIRSGTPPEETAARFAENLHGKDYPPELLAEGLRSLRRAGLGPYGR